jgi:glycosyltransferase involved in cell wall biosynthesis
MKISFVIPAYNEEARLPSCLASILDEIARNRCDPEIIVANNASTDRTAEVALSCPGVQVVDEPRKGITWARRAGYLASSGELIANIDADNLLPRGWLARVLTEFERDEALLALSGPLVYYDLPSWHRLSARLFYAVGFVGDRLNRFLFRKGSMLQGGNYVVRREALDRIDGYDTSIDFYGEDTDVGRRLHEIGKVKWTFHLTMYSSGRRIRGEGLFTVGASYAVNFVWTALVGRPFTTEHEDFRV